MNTRKVEYRVELRSYRQWRRWTSSDTLSSARAEAKSIIRHWGYDTRIIRVETKETVVK